MLFPLFSEQISNSVDYSLLATAAGEENNM